MDNKYDEKYKKTDNIANRIVLPLVVGITAAFLSYEVFSLGYFVMVILISFTLLAIWEGFYNNNKKIFSRRRTSIINEIFNKHR
jgi:uncharacterized membrane protein